MTGDATAALDHFHASLNGLLLQLPFRSPTADRVGEPIAFTGRHRPGSTLRTFHRQVLLGSILDLRALLEHSVMKAIEQADGDVVPDVLEAHGERVARDQMILINEDHIAIAVGSGDLQRGLGEARATPGRVLFAGACLRRIEGGTLWCRACRGKVVLAGDRRAPVDGLELVAFVDAEHIGRGRSGNEE